MSEPVKIRNWSFGFRDKDNYVAPEVRNMYLFGKVYGHPNQPDGKSVRTSPVLGSNKRLIHCYSRDYILDGPPDPEFVKFCEQMGTPLDPEDPFGEKTKA